MPGEFDQHRPMLFALAYRMLGSASDAEDIVQEAWLRWERTNNVERPRSWLASVVSNLCIDQLKSARSRREQYVGPWLPEPLVIDQSPLADEKTELAESVSMAFLVLLESLSPLERAVFLLREVFDYDYAELAQILGRSEESCRQLLSRARSYLKDKRPRFETNEQEQQQIVGRFLQAAMSGDLKGLESLLAQNAVALSDGGGKRHAARVPVIGAAKIAKFVLGIARVNTEELEYRFGRVNHQPALLLYSKGEPYSVQMFSIENGKIARIHSVLNPDKLRAIPSL
ncbi:MAG: RNA polymerase sigma-70 factor [Chrysiogenetes bacterium]|nr:RNA polymerase sigma-70 factor [Chrysiogenetes bacterium]